MFAKEYLQDWTASTEENLVSFGLSLMIRDQRDVCISSFLEEISEHHLEMRGEFIPVESVFLCHNLQIFCLVYMIRLKI